MTKEPITGNEICKQEATPYSALVDFYRAFNQRDLAATQNNWLTGGDITMSNPLGGVKRGWQAISQVYEKIFHGDASVYVEFYDYTINQTAEMFVASGREAGQLVINGNQLELEIRTSRIFRLHQQQWRQVHHHGSMDDAELLRAYQRLLNK